MRIIERQPLAGLTTFRIGGDARFFCSVRDSAELAQAVAFARDEKLPILILGGGSNLLVSDGGFEGIVIKIEVKGIVEHASEANLTGEGDLRGQDSVLIRAGAGENWDDLVAWCVGRGYGGLENLSLIPGTVGAAPVQNIGAYGVEAASCIESVEAFNLDKGEMRTFANEECAFSYRDSVFKREKGRYAILSVTFNLKKDGGTNISYKDVKEYFNNQDPRDNDQTGAGTESLAPSIAQVRDAVIAIRTAKLPDMRSVGTAGSFFKNPIIEKSAFELLKKKYPELPSFPEADGRVKVPLAWIIDKVCGLKGKRFGRAGIHDAQALVIVNYGGATFADVDLVAREVESKVKEKTGIEIEREVVMVS